MTFCWSEWLLVSVEWWKNCVRPSAVSVDHGSAALYGPHAELLRPRRGERGVLGEDRRERIGAVVAAGLRQASESERGDIDRLLRIELLVVRERVVAPEELAHRVEALVAAVAGTGGVGVLAVEAGFAERDRDVLG